MRQTLRMNAREGTVLPEMTGIDLRTLVSMKRKICSPEGH